jgi:hypothetical protein
MEISDIQQFMSQERYISLAAQGRASQDRILLAPGMIQGDFLVAPVDLTQPVNRGEQSELMLKLAQVVGGVPALASQFDIVEIIKEAFFQAGIKDIDSYTLQQAPIQARVQPTDQVLAAAQAGNLVPTPPTAVPELAALQHLVGMLRGGGR